MTDVPENLKNVMLYPVQNMAYVGIQSDGSYLVSLLSEDVLEEVVHEIEALGLVSNITGCFSLVQFEPVGDGLRVLQALGGALNVDIAKHIQEVSQQNSLESMTVADYCNYVQGGCPDEEEQVMPMCTFSKGVYVASLEATADNDSNIKLDVTLFLITPEVMEEFVLIYEAVIGKKLETPSNASYTIALYGNAELEAEQKNREILAHLTNSIDMDGRIEEALKGEVSYNMPINQDILAHICCGYGLEEISY